MTRSERMLIEGLQLRGLSERTQESYVRAVRQLAEHRSAWSAVQAIPPGAELRVETRNGETINGRLHSVSDATLTISRKNINTELDRAKHTKSLSPKRQVTRQVCCNRGKDWRRSRRSTRSTRSAATTSLKQTEEIFTMVVFARAIDPKHLLAVFTLLLALTVIGAFAGGTAHSSY
jgi:small nuclear ribonucleoprotein (snRNP)-like protein